MNWKAATPLVLAVVLGLVAAKLGRDVLLRGRVRTEQVKLAKVVVAVTDLEVGQTLRPEHLTEASVSLEHQPRNAFATPTELAGRVLVVPAVRGQAVLESMLAGKGAGEGPAALIPPGMRAVSVEVNETYGLAGIIMPGAHVDVVATVKDSSADETVTRTIVENVKVLAVGQRLSAEPTKGSDPNNLPRSATLLVAPRDAEAIELASNSGRVRLSLRSPLDDGTSRSRGLTVLNLLGRTRSGGMDAFSRILGSMPKGPAMPVGQQGPTQTVAKVEPPTTQPVERRLVEVIRNGVASRVAVEPAREGNSSAVTNTDNAPVIPGRVEE